MIGATSSIIHSIIIPLDSINPAIRGLGLERAL
jgi:hypothetical protein